MWTAHDQSVFSLAFDESGAHVLSGDIGGSVRVTSLSHGGSGAGVTVMLCVRSGH